jgi:LPXTG-site transpeptidase (sortase) family protein
MENNTPEKLNEEAKKKRRKRNRLFNTVLYIVAAVLIISGVIIILRDQTDIFNHNTAEIPDVTRPPDSTPGPWVTAPPPTEIASDAPLPSAGPYETPGQTPGQNETPAPDHTAGPGATTAPGPHNGGTGDPSAPVGVYFEEHGISVKVIPVGVNANGEMATVPTHDIAGWYKYGSAPNEPGNCIIAGHNRYHGQKGLFSILHKGLKVGDHVWVTLESGDVVFYTVESITSYKYDAVPTEVMAQTWDTRLTLITCLGDYDHILHMSRTRVVAVCRPIN